MSVVLPPPLRQDTPHYPLPRSGTPSSAHSRQSSPSPSKSHQLSHNSPSRANTPPTRNHHALLASHPQLGQGLQPLSAPPTPITTTHLLPVDMERRRSSEARLASPVVHHLTQTQSHPPTLESSSGERSGRGREVKATSLLFEGKALPSPITKFLDSRSNSAQSMTQLRSDSSSPKPKVEWEHFEQAQKPSTSALADQGEDQDDKMDIDEPEPDLVQQVEAEQAEIAAQVEAHRVWGMPKWGWEEERGEVSQGVRLIGVEELSLLIEQHALIDTPSQVLFPWLHGISDDGPKGANMGQFFGHYPPFEPPPYRGLAILLSPPHPLDAVPLKPTSHRAAREEKPEPVAPLNETPSGRLSRGYREPRERSETMSTSSESYQSSGTTELTSLSVTDSWKNDESLPSPPTPMSPLIKTPPPPSPLPPIASVHQDSPSHEKSLSEETEQDVQMHPCESKRVSLPAMEKGLDQVNHPLPCAQPDQPDSSTEMAQSEKDSESTGSSNSSDSLDLEDETSKPSCLLLNALHVQDIFDMPAFSTSVNPQDRVQARFKPARLPHQINLRNLNIQQIKYSTISDIILYARNGLGNGVLQVAEMIAQAQQELWEERMSGFYACQQPGEEGEGLSEPVRYGVWVVVEPFTQLEKHCPHLINVDAVGEATRNSYMTDLFDREAKESRNMTRGTEVLEGFWVGNDCDVPGGADDGAGATVDFDLCVRASECCDMPTTSNLNLANKKLVDLDKKKKRQQRNLQLKLGINTTPGKTDHDSRSPGQSWLPSPATIALRNLLSASPSSSTTTESGLKRVASPTPQDKNRYNRPRTRSTDQEEQEQVAQEEADKPTREYISIDCAGSCRTFTGQMRNLHVMTERVIELVTFLRKQIEGKEKRKVLVHCQDGYTESSIIVLAYIMASMSISLPEAFLHLQQTANRSFFLYPSDKPLLRRIDDVLFLERRKKAKLLIESTADTPSSSPERSTSPTESISSLASGKSNTGTSPSTFGSNLTSRDKWRSWSFFGAMPRSEDATRSQLEAQEAEASAKEKEKALQLALGVVAEQDAGGSATTRAARQWFDDGRFDGFPSRILPFLYLGNIEHAGNALMLNSIGITHVVSVGESLLGPQNPITAYGGNNLRAAAEQGMIKVLDLADIRDDGNDPLRPLIARACAWIEAARLEGGCTLVHCRVGVSRSASIVIAYMMQYERMGLMDAYLITRARRLNVLIQPNLRFFHELFGWEVELAKREAWEGRPRRIVYSWPSFCRDLHCLNRRFLCN